LKQTPREDGHVETEHRQKSGSPTTIEVVDDVREDERHWKRNDPYRYRPERRADDLAADDIAQEQTRDKDDAEIDKELLLMSESSERPGVIGLVHSGGDGHLNKEMVPIERIDKVDRFRF
jgi:hypothetical protein